ncbi:Cuticular protein 92F [Carabus blaptoides fortunei]
MIIFASIVLVNAAPNEDSKRAARQFGSYSFSYTGDNLEKSEVRDSDGTTYGAYSFVDEYGKTNQIKYIAGANRGFQVLSHKVLDNGHITELRSGDTPEVIAARDSHLRYQAQVKAALPQLEEQRPHFQQQFQPLRFEQPQQHIFQQQPQQFFHQPLQQIFHQKQTILHETPIIYRRIPIPIEEMPPMPILEVVHPQHLVVTHVPSPVRNLPVVPIVEVLPPQKIAKFLQQSQHVEPPIQHDVTVPETQHFEAQSIPHTALVQNNVFPQAHDIQLIDGFTPEVAAARDQHLATFAQIKASLPDMLN